MEAAAASNAASVTPGASGQTGQADKSAPTTQAQDPKTQAQGKAQAAGDAKDKAAGAVEPVDDFEEVKIGSVAGKVPKALAKAMKDLERGFHSKSQESATTRKQFEALAKAAKANPDVMFEVFGVDADQYSQARMAKWLEQQMLTPDQKRMRELEEKEKTWKQREAEEKERQDKEQLTAAEAKEEQEIQDSLLKAWKESFPGSDPDPWIGQKIVATFMAAQDQQLGWTWEQCAARVKQDLESADRRRLSKMPVEAIREMLGDEILKKLREDDVKRVTDKASQSAAKKTQSKSSPGSSPASPKKNFEGRQVVNQDEWDEAWNNL
jgi:hypothetical protein